MKTRELRTWEKIAAAALLRDMGIKMPKKMYMESAPMGMFWFSLGSTNAITGVAHIFEVGAHEECCHIKIGHSCNDAGTICLVYNKNGELLDELSEYYWEVYRQEIEDEKKDSL